MTAHHRVLLMALVMGAGMFAGCARDPGKASGVPHSQAGLSAKPVPADEASAASVDAAGGAGNGSWVTVPAALRFPGVVTLEAASSWDTRVAEFSELDQAYLADVSGRYFGVVEFQSEAGQRQMVRQGFPMPREWLAARGMSYAELEQLAHQGNSKAKMFYVDRVAREIGSIRGRGEGLKPTPEGRALLGRFARAGMMVDDLLQRTRSPFAAYLKGRLNAAGTFDTPPELFAASFEVAKGLGHARANELQRDFFRLHPDMDATVLMAGYSSLYAALRGYSPADAGR